MVQTRRAATDVARGQTTRSGRVPQQRVEAQLEPAFGDRDVRLRSTAAGARKREAQRRLMDEDEAAGKASGNLCAFTGPNTAEYNKGKRPWAFSERKVGKAANTLCQPGVKEAWSDPKHVAEEKRLCGDRNWVYGYKRGDKRVKAHCRKLSGPQKQSMEVAMAKQTMRRKERELAALIRKRNNTNSLSTIAKLEKQIKALRTELKPPREPVMEEPDDISQYDFTSVRPKKGDDSPRTPPGRRAPPRRRRKATARTPRVVTSTMQTYIDSLPRGERAKAKRTMTAYVNFGSMDATEAIQRYKQRRIDDNREGIDNAGDFEDELDTDDESDDDGPSGGALTAGLQVLIDDPEWSAANPQLHGRLIDRMGMSRGDEISKRTEEIGSTREKAEREMIANAAAAAARSRHIAASTAFKNLSFTDPSRDSLGIFGSPGTPASVASVDTPGTPGTPAGNSPFAETQSGSGKRHGTHTIINEALSQSFGGEGDGSRESTVPIVNALFPLSARTLALDLPINRNAPLMHDALRVAHTQIQREQQQREAQRRAREEWEAALAASRAAQREDGSGSEDSGTEPFA